MKFKDWSNVFFLVPVLAGIYYSLTAYATFVFVVSLVSFLYHISSEKRLDFLDSVLALALILTNLLMVFMRTPSIFAGIALTFLIFASGVFYLRQWKKGYNVNHGMYHVVSSAICLMVLIIYI